MGVNIASLILGITSPGALVSLCESVHSRSRNRTCCARDQPCRQCACASHHSSGWGTIEILLHPLPASAGDLKGRENGGANRSMHQIPSRENGRERWTICGSKSCSSTRSRTSGTLDPEALGFSMRYQLPMADLATYVSILRSILTVAPEIYLSWRSEGGCRAQSANLFDG